MPRTDPYEGLNDAQREVVAFNEGKIVVCSVAGSGKTLTVIRRMSRLELDGQDPKRIVATTFTTKAAGEMNDRLAAEGCPVRGRGSDEGARVGTFHSVSLEVIRDGAPEANYKVDGKNRMKLELKKILGHTQMDWKGVDLTEVESWIAHNKHELVRPEESRHPEDRRFDEAYARHEETRDSLGLITFDDMPMLAVEYLRSDRDARDRWSTAYDHVIVDEAQDANKAQWALAEILGENAKSIMLVGDDDQSIYEWRGAVPAYLIEYAKRATVVKLEINYRCRPEIVDAGNKVIKHNTDRIKKSATAARPDAATVKYRRVYNLDAEAELALEQIREIVADGVKYGEIAILYRTNAQSRAFEEVFLRESIPHVVIGGTDFYDRKEVKDLLNYLKLASKLTDNKAFRDCVNRPFRFIGKQTIEKMQSEAESRGISMWKVCRMVAEGEIRLPRVNASQLRNLREFRRTVKKARSILKEESSRISDVFLSVLRESKYLEWLKRDEGSDTSENSRESNVRELIRTSDRFETVKEFLEYLDNLAAEKRKRKNGETGNLIQLMTVHKSKGLEFPVVFVSGATELILPHARTANPEEERRLYYVAITRARDQLYVTSPACLLVGGKVTELDPSRFVNESEVNRYAAEEATA